MKAVVSTTYDHQYLFFLPITTWLWNKLGVEVICFAPYSDYMGSEAINQIPAQIMRDSLVKYGLRCDIHYFKSPKHKAATYAQCSRLFPASLDLPEDEILITSDIDMGVFKLLASGNDSISIYGADLVPERQYPICYMVGNVKTWREAMKINGRSTQKCLDDLLGSIEDQHMRGNYWGKDQETAFGSISEYGKVILHNRAHPGTQFSTNRIDRDDAYFMDRLSPDIIDFHMHRPGYTDDNFQKIISVIQYFYPNDNLSWMKEYRDSYVELI